MCGRNGVAGVEVGCVRLMPGRQTRHEPAGASLSAILPCGTPRRDRLAAHSFGPPHFFTRARATGHSPRGERR